jgi:predicted alpha/beta superfamily hydrolase
MKRRQTPLAAIACAMLLLVSPSTWAVASDGRAIVIGLRFSLRSQILKEERTYDLYLPSSYGNGSSRYPVLYLLDGESFFASFASTVHYEGSGINANTRFPEMIVVAIHNTDRNRDLTPTHSVTGAAGKPDQDYANSGGLDNFLRFLHGELIPHIDATYRTTGYRILVGHSLAGLAVVHTLLTQPKLFDVYLALDPSLWWDSGLELNIARQSAKDLDLRRKQVFIAGAGEQRTRLFGAIDLHVPELVAALKANLSTGLTVTHHHYADEDHGSVPLVSFTDGLSQVFAGHKIDLATYYDHPETIDPQFKALSQRLGTELHPPEAVMNDLGQWFLNADGYKDVRKALIYFEMNARNYPESSNVWDSLAEGVLERGDSNLAITYFRKSLALEPRNDHARQMLEKLGAHAAN